MDAQQKQHAENQGKLDKLLELSIKQKEWNENMEKKINPMFLVFSNIKNFNSVTVLILKALILLGSAMVAVAGGWKLIKFVFKN